MLYLVRIESTILEPATEQEPGPDLSFLLDLPVSVLLEIFDFFEPEELHSASEAFPPQLRLVAEDNALWRAICRQVGIRKLPADIPVSGTFTIGNYIPNFMYR